MSSNAFKVFSVITYFINKTSKCHHIILGLCEVISKHNNKNIAAMFLKIFKDYRINNNIRYFMADNAELNDMCIKAIL